MAAPSSPSRIGTCTKLRRPARRARDDSDGRPFSDHTGAMLLLEGVSTEEARRVFDLDPFMKNQVFVVDDIRERTIFVDSPTAPEAGAQP
jgi:hypothetical protein